MAKTGRKPKPTALKRLEGNPGKRQLNEHEPVPPKSIIRCPAWLEAEAKKEWKRLAPSLEAMGILTSVDITAFAGYCQAYARWKEAEEFITQQAGLLRRMTATGHSIGILVDGAQNAQEQLEAANAALARTTFGKTRLVMLQNGDAETRAAVERMGYRCLRFDLDRTSRSLKTSADATDLLHSVAQRDKDSVVWLGDTATGAGLRSFLSMTVYAELGGCPAWTETT